MKNKKTIDITCGCCHKGCCASNQFPANVNAAFITGGPLAGNDYEVLLISPQSYNSGFVAITVGGVAFTMEIQFDCTTLSGWGAGISFDRSGLAVANATPALVSVSCSPFAVVMNFTLNITDPVNGAPLAAIGPVFQISFVPWP